MARLFSFIPALLRLPRPAGPSLKDFRRLATSRPRQIRVLKEAGLVASALLAALLVSIFVFGRPGAGGPEIVLVFADSPPAVETDHEGGITAAIKPPEDTATDHTRTANPLIEEHSIGPLPRIAEDGRSPAHVYSRRARPNEARPMVSLVVEGLGRRSADTAKALEVLPPDVSLVFDAYSQELDRWGAMAREKGHEYLIAVPVEPFDFPANDPGPLALRVQSRDSENLTRLRIALTRMPAFAGVALSGRTRLATDEAAMTTLMTEARARGLLVFDTSGSPVSKVARVGRKLGSEWGTSDRRLDRNPTQDGVALQLLELERLALERGHAIGTTEPFPHVLARIPAWADSLASKGLVLVPVSVHMLKEEPAGLTAATSSRSPSSQPHATDPHAQESPSKARDHGHTSHH